MPEADLTGLVDDEHVDLRAVLGGEPPGGAAEQVGLGIPVAAGLRLPPGAALDHRGVAERARVLLVPGDLLVPADRAHAVGRDAFGPVALDPPQHVVDRRVAVRRDADTQAVLDQRVDDAGEGVGLARAGRALDAEPGAVELSHRVDGGVEHVRRVDERRGHDGRSGFASGEPWRGAAQELVQVRVGVPALGEVAHDAAHGPRDRRRVERAARHQSEALGRLAEGGAAFQHEHARARVEHEHGARARPALQVRLRARAELRLLGREAEAVGVAPLVGLAPVRRIGDAAAEAVGVVDERVGRRVLALEEGPPVRLGLAVVEAQEIGGEPARLAFARVGDVDRGDGARRLVETCTVRRIARGIAVRAIGARTGRVVDELALEAGDLVLDVAALDVPLLALLALAALGVRLRLRALRRVDVRLVVGARPRHALDLVGAGEQPIVQQHGRHAVVAVVGLDVGERSRVARRAPGVVHDDAVAAVGRVGRARVHVERLELLDRVARRADAEPLAHDAVQIDEAPAPEQLVDERLARAVRHRQALHRALLVRRVVVEVRLGMNLEVRHQRVDERLEAPPLLVPVVRPERAEAVRRLPRHGRAFRERAVDVGAREHAAQVLEPARFERIALEVEEQVGGVGGRQTIEPEPRAPRQELPLGRDRRAAFGRTAGLGFRARGATLQRGLFDQSVERLDAQAHVGPRLGRCAREIRQRAERRDVRVDEPAALLAADVGHA